MSEPRWTRRSFLKAAAAGGAAAAWPAVLRARPAPNGAIRVGLVVPESVPLAEAGRAAARGARLGEAEAAQLARLLERGFELSAGSAADARESAREATRLLEAGASAIVGGLDEATCRTLGDLCDERGALFLNIGCAGDVLRGERCRRHAFHVAASTAMRADALAGWLAAERGLRRWHLVTPGGATGERVGARVLRALREAGGEEAGRSTPDAEATAGTLDTIERARPDVVLLALTGEPRSEFLRRWGERGLEPELAVLFPPQAPPWHTPSETRHGIWPVLWHHKLFRYGAEQVSDRFADRFDAPPDSSAWAAWAAVKIFAESALRARTEQGGELVRYLEGRRAQFDGHKGRSLTFRPWDHQLRQPIYLVRARAGATPDESLEPLAELPLGEPGGGENTQDFLDRLGDGPDETSCRFEGV